MNSIKILPVIVLYNSKLQDQLTYKSILKDKRWNNFVVYDNSSLDIYNTYIQDDRAIYYRDKRNSGLSAAYNYAAIVSKKFNYNWLLILDQDTLFPENAYYEYLHAIETHPCINLFVPNIELSNGTPFSPSKKYFMNIRGVKLDVGIYNLNDYMPVNSGICVNIKEFQKCGGYNEKIHLDFTDYNFIDRFKKYNAIFCVINITALQSFSNEEKKTSILIMRFKQYTSDTYNYIKTLDFISKIKVIVLFVKHTTALTIRTKNACFYTYIIKKIIKK